MTAASRLDDLDRDGEQLRDQGQPEGQVGLSLGRAPAGSLEREVMRRERARGLGHGAEVLGAPDPLVVALAVEAGQDAVGARELAHQPQARQQLQPVGGERQVGHVTLGVRSQRVAQQLEHRLEDLLPGDDEERAPRGRRGEVVPESLDEPGALPLHPRQEGEHLHREDRRRAPRGIEHRLPASLLEGLLRQLAAEELRDVAGDGVRRPPHPWAFAMPRPPSSCAPSRGGAGAVSPPQSPWARVRGRPRARACPPARIGAPPPAAAGPAVPPPRSRRRPGKRAADSPPRAARTAATDGTLAVPGARSAVPGGATVKKRAQTYPGPSRSARGTPYHLEGRTFIMSAASCIVVGCFRSRQGVIFRSCSAHCAPGASRSFPARFTCRGAFSSSPRIRSWCATSWTGRTSTGVRASSCATTFRPTKSRPPTSVTTTTTPSVTSPTWG